MSSTMTTTKTMFIFNDHVASCNNSTNDNLLNEAKKRKKKNNNINSKTHQLKTLLLKPLLTFLSAKRQKNQQNIIKTNCTTYTQSPQPQYCDDDAAQQHEDADEDMENKLNEELEERLLAEIDESREGDAIPVYRSDGTMDIVPVFRGQKYIPVHFAKTDAGTFFWTSMVMRVDDRDDDCCDYSSSSTSGCNCCCCCSRNSLSDWNVIGVDGGNAITQHQTPAIQVAAQSCAGIKDRWAQA